MRKFLGLLVMILFAGCTLFDAPEGDVELSPRSVHIRSEKVSPTEEIVYCCADIKVTNTGNKTIYDCTVSAVATSDKGIEHYISMHCDVNIPPSKSVYLKIEWQLVKKIETKTETTTETNTEISEDSEGESSSNATSNSSSGSSSSTTSSTSSGTTTSTTITTTETASDTEESSWNKSSVKILDYFFN